jgi:hypothetical protein
VAGDGNWFSLQLNDPKPYYTKAFLNFNTMQKWTTEGLPLTAGTNINWHANNTLLLKVSSWINP